MFNNISWYDFWSVGVILLILITWGVLALFNHRFRAWVVPTFCALAIAGNAAAFFIGNSIDGTEGSGGSKGDINGGPVNNGGQNPNSGSVLFNTDYFDIFVGEVFRSEDIIDKVSGVVIDDDDIVAINISFSIGNLTIHEDTIAPSREWEYNNPPLLPYVNTIAIMVEFAGGGKSYDEIKVLCDQVQNYDMNLLDTGDDDGDGLLNWQEIALGTDPNNPDTDGDGLTDYEEVYITFTDPLVYDSHTPGVSDADADIDGDGISNIDEIRLYGTDPLNSDTDGDGLSDYEELFIYNTDPLNTDSDGDGASDYWEVHFGFDPNVYNSSFENTVDTGTLGEHVPVTAGITATLGGEQLGTLEIESVSAADNWMLAPTIPGYLGQAYDFSVEGDISSAYISMDYNTDLGFLNDDFQPRIYYYNEETGDLEELPEQTIDHGSVSAPVDKLGKYILLNKVAFDVVWDVHIRPPGHGTGSPGSFLDVVFVIDESNSMENNTKGENNDPDRIRVSAAKQFTESFNENDMAAVIGFASDPRKLLSLEEDMDVVRTYIDRIVGNNGGTQIFKGIEMALDELLENGRDGSWRAIIVLTDGEDDPTVDIDVYMQLIERAKREGVIIYTIGLGNELNERLLVRLASETSGTYFHATDAEEMYEGYEIIHSDLIDYELDTNGDGLPDYYARLIFEGKLRLQNGSAELMGTDFTRDPDMDGDGLLNGEEIKVVERNGRYFVHMISHPLLKDSDFDGIDDMNDPQPLIPNYFNDADVDTLMRNSSFEYWKYTEAYDPGAFRRGWDGFVIMLTGTNLQQVVTVQMAEFFSDLVSEEYINQMTMLIMKQNSIVATWYAINEITGLALDNIELLDDVEREMYLAGAGIRELLRELEMSIELGYESGDIEAFNGFIPRVATILGDVFGIFDDVLFTPTNIAYDIVSAIAEFRGSTTSSAFDAMGDYLFITGLVLNIVDLAIDNSLLADIALNIAVDEASKQVIMGNFDILTELTKSGFRVETRRAAQFLMDSALENLESLAELQRINAELALQSTAIDVTLFVLGKIPKVGAVITIIKAAFDVSDIVFGLSDNLETQAAVFSIAEMTYVANRLINRAYHSDEAVLTRHLNNLVNLRIAGETQYSKFRGIQRWGDSSIAAARENVIEIRRLADRMGLYAAS